MIARGWLISLFCYCLFLSCTNLDWFFNRDQQQINKVDWICHRKQHFGHKLVRPRNRLLCYFIPSLLTPSPSFAYLSFFQLFIHFYFFVCYFFLLSELMTYFLFFFPCPLVAVAMARHAKLSPSASCMTGLYVENARALTENYRGALYLTSHHLQFYTQLTLNRLS